MNKIPQFEIKSLLIKDLMINLKSFHPVVHEGWLIKFSTHRDLNILLTFVSIYTSQTVVRYFTSEEEAVIFINYIMNKDARLIHKL
jgi:hypothetical protein